MEKIQRLTTDEFNKLIRSRKIIGNSSSESIVYRLKDNIILKDLKSSDLYDFNHPDKLVHSEEQLLRFSDIKSLYYYFVQGVIYVDNYLRACLMYECNGFVVNEIDALTINLTNIIKAINRFSKETLKISKKGIKGFDMESNFMYDGKNFGAIDTIHYYFSDEDENSIYKSNINYFNNDVITLLVNFYFMDFVSQNKILNEMYESIKNGESLNLIDFIDSFRNSLSEYCGRRIIYLSDAEDAIRENPETAMPSFTPVYSLRSKTNQIFD